LGYVREGEILGERGERVIYLNAVEGVGSVSLRQAQSHAQGPYDRYAIGLHLCFMCQSRAVVDERAEWLRDQGAEVESGPREYDYTAGFYAVFFYDPDGLKLELLHRPNERDLVVRIESLARRGLELEQSLVQEQAPKS
jgi:catechol 2,3-dioxygenase-like lactoylglutathione lyase family enzyme